jgi:hypothetical protein
MIGVAGGGITAGGSGPGVGRAPPPRPAGGAPGAPAAGAPAGGVAAAALGDGVGAGVATGVGGGGGGAGCTAGAEGAGVLGGVFFGPHAVPISSATAIVDTTYLASLMGELLLVEHLLHPLNLGRLIGKHI